MVLLRRRRRTTRRSAPAAWRLTWLSLAVVPQACSRAGHALQIEWGGIQHSIRPPSLSLREEMLVFHCLLSNGTRTPSQRQKPRVGGARRTREAAPRFPTFVDSGRDSLDCAGRHVGTWRLEPGLDLRAVLGSEMNRAGRVEPELGRRHLPTAAAAAGTDTASIQTSCAALHCAASS